MGVKQFVSGILHWGKDHAADLKMGVGTAAVVGGTVLLCRESVKAADIYRNYKEEKQKMTEQEAEDGEIRALKLKTAGKVALTLLPGAVVETAGLGSMWDGYSDMKVAFIGVGAAYSGLQAFMDKYRQGVRDKYGEDADEELAYGWREEEVTVKGEDGKERTETVRIYPHESRKMPSTYARYFCYGEAEGAERSFEYNGRFLSLQENLANAYFRSRKKFMLNDLYDMLGIRRSKAGNHVGWVYDPEAPEGDNQIRLRAKVVCRETLDEDGKPDGWERVWMIDPNVDGMVEDKMIRMGLIDE